LKFHLTNSGDNTHISNKISSILEAASMQIAQTYRDFHEKNLTEHNNNIRNSVKLMDSSERLSLLEYGKDKFFTYKKQKLDKLKRDGEHSTIKRYIANFNTSIKSLEIGLLGLLQNELTDEQSLIAPSIVNLCKDRALLPNEEALLLKGLTFCPNYKKPSYYQLQVDLLRFERKLSLREYFSSDSVAESDLEASAVANPIPDSYQRVKAVCKKSSNFMPECKDPNLKSYIKSVRTDIN